LKLDVLQGEPLVNNEGCFRANRLSLRIDCSAHAVKWFSLFCQYFCIAHGQIVTLDNLHSRQTTDCLL